MFSDCTFLDNSTKNGISCVELCDPRGRYKGKLDKINNWLSFRKAFLRYKKNINSQDSVIWIGNGETFLALKGILNKYNTIITYLELYDQMPRKRDLLKKMTQNAMAVITREETRSYLMKNWFDLKKLPYIMPNKPYQVSQIKNSNCTTDMGKEIIKELSGRKFVIYQGIFQNYEFIVNMAKALRDALPDYCFVMMGIDRKNIASKIKAINPNTIISNYIPAPLHLEVTSNAAIGFLFYAPDCLNKVFCAPNKIFEYSNFGLPMIGNSIPGLENTIGKAGAGICTDLTYEGIKEALLEIVENYEQYSVNSYRFFASVDNVKTMKKIIEDVGIEKQRGKNEEL